MSRILVRNFIYGNRRCCAPKFTKRSYCSYDVKLKEHLRVRLRYDGAMTYPSEVWPVDLTQDKDEIKDGFEGKFLSANEALPMREHMLKTFYRSAPIPRATGLARLAGGTYLEEEIGSMLSSGLTYEITDKASGKIAFCGLSATWTYNSSSSSSSRNNSSSSNISNNKISQDMRDWLNASSDVIQDQMPDYPELTRLASWRDLQVQHLHRLGRDVAESDACSRCIYSFSSYVAPEFRHHHLSGEWVRRMGQVARDSQGVMFFMVTFGMSEELIHTMCSYSNSKLIGYVPYSDLRMNILDENRNAFKDLADQGEGIQIFRNK